MQAPRTLQIRLLGGFRVAVDGQAVPDAAWRRKRAAAVIKLLALEPAHRLHPEQLSEALWPERDPAAAANSLRVALHHARQRLHAAGDNARLFLGREGELIALGPAELVEVDSARFETAVQAAWQSPDPEPIRAALALYGGDLLPEDLYEDWAAGRRAALRASHLALLRRLAQLHQERGENGLAIVALQRLLAAEPLDEDAHDALLRALALSGRRHEAAAHYGQLVALLQRELGAEPAPATQELMTAIREGRLPDTAPSPDPTPTTVLPQGLPAPLDELIGRERELAELRRLLATTRLLTLTGPGGVGKTRLALAAAQAAAAAFPDGAYFADLAPLEDPALVLPTLARATGAREVAGQPLRDALADHLGQRRVLLVIDNMEHVAAAAPEVTALLTSCPALALLITSRARLRLRGEQEYAVPPLAVPDPPPAAGHAGPRALPATALADVPAVALFARRARAARSDFALTGDTAGIVADICRHLDGLPLAIELAAARVRHLTPAELRHGLQRPLALLTGGPLDAPARQRTLRATIAWSHDLLTPEEQDLFARLSVFAGGCTLDAATWVSDEVGSRESEVGSAGGRVAGWQGDESGVGSQESGGRRACHPATPPPRHPSSPDTLTPRHPETQHPSPHDPITLVSSLLDQSLLLQVEEPDGTSRLAMLETIREYARERLEFRGEAEAVRRRHAAYFLTLAASAAPELDGEHAGHWLDRLEREHDNLRQALTTLHDAGETADTLRLTAALWRFWWQRGYLSEGRSWLEEALLAGEAAPPTLRADARDGAGALAEAQGDLVAAALHHEEALRLRRESGDRGGEARSLADLGIVADKLGDPERAADLFSAGLAIAREHDDRPRIAACLANLGFVSLDLGVHQRAAACFRESLALFRELEDRRNCCYVLGGLGNLAFLQGDYAGAAAVQEEALRLLRELGDAQGIAETLADLAHAVQRQGTLDRAELLFSEALARFRDLGDRGGAAFVLTHLGRLSHERGDSARAASLLAEGMRAGWQAGELPLLTEAVEGLAEVACGRGEALRCARLLGAAEVLRETTGIPLPAVHAPAIAHCAATARAALGDAGFTAARGEGRALAPERTIAALLEGST